jgi:hypothetical protein
MASLLKVARVVNVVHVAPVLANTPLIRSALLTRISLEEKAAIPMALERVAAITQQKWLPILLRVRLYSLQ